MKKLARIMIDHLEHRGIHPHLVKSFIRDFVNIIRFDPEIPFSRMNRKLHLLGWDDFELDYHIVELTRAVLESENYCLGSGGT